MRPHDRTGTDALLVRASALLGMLLTGIAWADDTPPPAEVATVEERLEEAWRRVDRGDWDGAILLAQDVSDRSPQDGAEAGYLEGVALSGAGRPDDAIRTFRSVIADYPNQPQALDATFRLAIVQGDQGAYDAALATLHELRPYRRLAPEGQKKVALCTATWSLDRTGSPSAAARLERALGSVTADELTWFQAMARGSLLQDAVHDADAVSLQVPDPRLADATTARGAYLSRASDQLESIADLHEVRFALEGILALAGGYVSAGEALLASPTPRKLPPDQAVRYEEIVRERSIALWIKASTLLDLGIDTAGRFVWAYRFTPRLQQLQDQARAHVDAARATPAGERGAD